MNDQFFKDAKAIIDNLTIEEIRKGLEEAGFDVTFIHSGKKLSEVPFDNIYIGMEVVSMDGMLGNVVRKRNKDVDSDDNWISILWEDGQASANEHCFFDSIKVK